MFRANHKSLSLPAILCVATVSVPMFGANGNMLHGIGAVNTAMGGAGVASSSDSIGALHLNPALLLDLDGERVDAGVTLLRSNLVVGGGVGPMSGKTDHDGGLDVVPALGWKRPQGRMALGIGLLGTAGFGSDFAGGGSNPLFAPQPFGFGRMESSYKMLKVPLSLAFRISPRVSLGVSAVGGMAQLSASPAGFVPPDCTAAGCFYPELGDATAFGFGMQVGAHFRSSERLSFGATYATPVRFKPFRWDTKSLNPAAGASRDVEFRIDAPEWYSFGVAWRGVPNTTLVADAKWMRYEAARGLGDAGIDRTTGAVRGLGWRNIFVIATGIEHVASDRITLRGGYNRGDSPIAENAAFFNVATAGVFEEHYSIGAGFKLRPRSTLNVAYYHAPSRSVEGAIPSLQGPVPSSYVRLTNGIDSVVVTLAISLREH